jgi:hypothetical protein
LFFGLHDLKVKSTSKVQQKISFSGVACINPPDPPPETNLVVRYVNKTVIPFGGQVSYACQTGFFFEEDYNLPYFNLTCLPYGNFSSPLPWKKCLNPRSEY